MKRAVALLLASVMSLSLVACSNPDESTKDNTSGETAAAVSDADYVKQFKGADELTVSKDKNVNNLTGLGVEWDPHFFRSFNTNKGVTEDDWNLIKERTKELGIQKIRIMYLPGFIEPENDNNDPNTADLSKFTFDSEAFVSLLRELDVAEEHGIEVNITVWGADLATTPWLTFPQCGDWLSAPNSPAEFAENASVLFSYLINTKGYQCVKEITIMNEPDWAFKNNDKKVDFDYYAAVCKATSEKFKKDGLRNKVKFILSDDAMNEKWLVDSLTNLSTVADGYDSHCYVFSSENTLGEMYEWGKKNNNHVERLDPGKPYMHYEFGSNKMVDAYHQSDIDTYERGMLYAMQAVSFLDAGSSGMLSWEYFDQYYYEGAKEDAMMQLGLFQYKDSNWKVRPIYHAWGLIMKHTKIGMEIYRIQSNDPKVGGVALKSSDGKWTYIVVNTSGGNKKIKISNPQVSGGLELNRYIYSKDTVTDSDKLIASDGAVRTVGSDTYVELGKASFAVLTDFN